MKYACSLSRFFSILFILLSPFNTTAQSPAPEFKMLNVSLWPEYDRLDVLVIYRLQLNADAKLPVQLRLRLPDYLEDIHALAVEQEGRLVNVDSKLVEWIRDESGVWLTFPTSSLNVHLEYYDPVILSKQQQTRRINYAFSAPAQIETAVFEIQHPIHAENVSLELERQHEPMTTYAGRSGFQYSTITVAKLVPDENFEVSATYQRNTGVLSRQPVQEAPTVQPEKAAAVSETPSKKDPFSHVFFVFVGAGLASLLWWLQGIGRRPSPDSDLPEDDEEDGEEE